MKQNKLLDTYNQPGNLLVITNYPPRGEGIHTAKIGGVSGFAKNTLQPLAKEYAQKEQKVVVLSEILDKPTIYEEDGMLIVRCWKRNTIKLYSNILINITTFNKIEDILVEFEFASYGDFVVTSIFPLLLGILKLMGKRTTLVLHQVITDIWSIAGHLGIRFASRKHKLFSILLPVYYFLLTHTATQTVVLEEEMKNRLKRLAPHNSVQVISHGVEDIQNTPSKETSRKKLNISSNEYVVLSFGFITWYKGTDILINAFTNHDRIHDKPVRLILAGGPSTSQQYKAHYQQYYQSIVTSAKENSQITLTGFVPDNKVALYFAAADIVVLPYRTVMSSSGPLSLALSYKKPILLSEAMSDYFRSDDVDEALSESRLPKRALILNTDNSKLVRSMELATQPGTIKKIKQFVTILAQKRNYTTLASRYVRLIQNHYTPAKHVKVQFNANTV